MSDVCLIYTLFASQDEAERVCQTLLDEGLVACANLLAPARSLYRWNDVLNDQAEWPAIIKTSEARSRPAMDRLAQLHSYDVPAIIMLDTRAVHLPFAAWVEAQTKGG